MLSRRRFLQSNVAALALPAVGSGSLAKDPGRQSPAPSASPKRDYWNDWPAYLASAVNEARARRKAALASLSTPAQVQERVQMVRAKVWELIGGPLERTPLNPVVVGSINRDAYRIEKVIFESQPQVFVTANLYVPTAGRPPFPGILAPLGHASNGKAYRNYQYVYQTLARKGYMVLAFDPFGQGERQQYLDPRTGRSRYGPTGEHSQAGRPLLLLGATFAQYRVWDATRALDYLVSRPEVDPQRLGCTGHSGGGTMTMYLCALEPRIQVAVEVQGNSENLAGPDYDPPGAVADAEQNLVGSLAVGLDRGDLLLAFAPKPLLLCYTSQDSGTTYSPVYEQATREIFGELQNVYRLLGALDRVQLFASSLPHDFDFFTRQASYGWFNRWLAEKELGTEEAEFDQSPPDALNCTSTGQILTSLGGRSVWQVNADRARAIVPPSPYRDASADASASRARLRTRLRSLLALPADRGPLQSATLSSLDRRGVTIEEFEFRSEPQVRVPGWFIRPDKKQANFPTVIYLSEDGKDQVVEEPSGVETLVRRGCALCAIDLRGLGMTAPRYPKAGPLFYGYGDPDMKSGYAWASLTLGRPVTGQRVWDFLRCLDYLETRPDVDRSQVHVAGIGGAGLAALLGVVLDDRPRSVLLSGVIADFRSAVESEDYALHLCDIVFGCLREFDLPDLTAALAPRRCWLLNPKGARGEALSESALRTRYEAAMDVYSKSAANDQFRFLVQPDQNWARVAEGWLGNL